MGGWWSVLGGWGLAVVGWLRVIGGGVYPNHDYGSEEGQHCE